MQKAKNNYCKEKAAKYYLKNKKELKEKSKIGIEIYQKKKKIDLKNIEERNISNWYSITDQTRKTDQKNFILLSIKMKLKFGEIKIGKKEFHKSKKSINLNLIDTSKIVISDRFELDEGDKYYIGYKDGEFVRPLFIILPQMSGFIKYFDGNRKNMSFLSEDEEIIIKYKKNGKK